VDSIIACFSAPAGAEKYTENYTFPFRRLCENKEKAKNKDHRFQGVPTPSTISLDSILSIKHAVKSGAYSLSEFSRTISTHFLAARPGEMAGRRIIPPIGRPVSTDAQAAGCLPPSVPGDSLFHPNFHDDDKECRYRIADIGSLRAIRGCFAPANSSISGP